MKKCNWCGKEFEPGLFSGGFCSKKCEIEGGDRGIKKTIPTSVVLIFILIAVISTCINRRNSDSNQIQENKKNENDYMPPKGTKNETTTEINNSSENSVDEEVNNSQNETKDVNSSIELTNENNYNQESPQNNNLIESNEEKAIRLLTNGKSVSDVADETGLSKHEIRKIKRKIE